jgi:hypothetical protein
VNSPDLFIAGAPKCGTTAMTEYLSRHPEVFVSDVKEIHFFGSDLLRKSPAPQLDEYLALFAGHAAKRHGDSSALYLYSAVAAREIQAFNPDARILILLRDPVDMIYSYYWELYSAGLEPIDGFSAALAAEPDRVAEAGDKLHPRAYRRVGAYAEQVERFFSTFGRERVHVIVFDDLRSDTARVYRETLEFLAVDSAFQTRFEQINPAKRSRNVAVSRRIARPPRVAETIGRALLPLRARRRLASWLLDSSRAAQPYPELSSDLRRELQVHFAPDVERLGGLLGRDLGHWSSD